MWYNFPFLSFEHRRNVLNQETFLEFPDMEQVVQNDVLLSLWEEWSQHLIVAVDSGSPSLKIAVELTSDFSTAGWCVKFAP